MKEIVAKYNVFATYGDNSVVADLEKVYPRYKAFSKMALSELRDGDDVPSLIRIAENPETTPNDKNFALRMLAQASRVSPETSQIFFLHTIHFIRNKICELGYPDKSVFKFLQNVV